MRQLFDIQFLSAVVRSKFIVINNVNNGVNTTTYFSSLCLVSHEWYLFHGIVKIK